MAHMVIHPALMAHVLLPLLSSRPAQLFIRNPQTLVDIEGRFEKKKHVLATNIQARFKGFVQRKQFLTMKLAGGNSVSLSPAALPPLLHVACGVAPAPLLSVLATPLTHTHFARLY